RDEVLAAAGGISQAILHSAEAERSRRLALAGSGADVFNALREARQYAPDLTDLRLFWARVAETLAGKAKIVLHEQPGRRRHLILPSLPWERTLPALQPALIPEREELPDSRGRDKPKS